MTINDLLQSYRTGRTTPRALLADLLQRLRTDADQAIFIHLLTDSGIEPYLAALDGRDPSSLPLFGVPFAIKDNIDLAQIPTTAACPEFAYTPERSATVVQRLLDAHACDDEPVAPALLPLRPSTWRRGSSSKASSTPQVNAPCAPPPCKARLMVLRAVFLAAGAAVSVAACAWARWAMSVMACAAMC